jgi:hypothetical protein
VPKRCLHLRQNLIDVDVLLSLEGLAGRSSELTVDAVVAANLEGD